ncbi:molybdopterin synthase catalytic subunit MoaE [Parasalinivibrio latis]|uniref:molybdopterin synthase catalytic subunit MoaE n=1 Tax=Parasalinivibrio latis TaxID=2952610 RepID=UPI0030E4BAC1
MISVQETDFSVAEEYERLSQGTQSGAIVTFVGKVRDFNEGDDVSGLTLEHYPGMTEKCLNDIVDESKSRWPLGQVRVIHRVGAMAPGDQIVFVGVTSAHRKAAFEAAEFVMDYLKTRAPFWKKERLGNNDNRWVEARASDNDAADKWSEK